jgi:hypothetical protein
MNDRAMIRNLEGFHDKRFLAYAALAVLAFVVVMGALIAGFRGNARRVAAGADAMTQPIAQPATRATPPPPPSK